MKLALLLLLSWPLCAGDKNNRVEVYMPYYAARPTVVRFFNAPSASFSCAGVSPGWTGYSSDDYIVMCLGDRYRIKVSVNNGVVVADGKLEKF